MVRSGLGLYGYCLPIEFADEADPHTDSQTGPQVRPGLQPIMTWKARIIGVRDVLAGDSKITVHLGADKLTQLFEPMAYQGVSQALIERLLASLDDK